MDDCLSAGVVKNAMRSLPLQQRAGPNSKRQVINASRLPEYRR